MSGDRSAQLRGVLDRVTELYNAGDYSGVVEFADPQVQLVRSWEKKVLEGPAAIDAWLQLDAFESQQSELLGVTDMGDDGLFVQARFLARGAGSGIPFEVESWALWTFDEAGKITRLEFFLQHEETRARAAAGLE